ncbi:PSD1 and planctomycete cytochrome C domain-containing protein [Roseiconus nitratireducens]|uniref:PSD1 and planctomycete cytochrome C domain-containing protein n=1 Tax=Roseiconus nitratireducens TaxID=2605748 RepID=UPI001375C676|nr:PSD1 and planctomycete cytochrome C domain-containing protein [Roseiconus nitratireducens]
MPLLATLMLAGVLFPTVEGLAEDASSGKRAERRRGLELFEKKIRPVLIEHCYECHASDSDDIGGNLLLDTRDGLRHGGDSGAAIRPGKPGASLLLRALQYDGMEMPPDEKLSDAVIADFRRWISLGAPDPRSAPAEQAEMKQAAGEASSDPVTLWSLQPIVAVEPPVIEQPDWALTELDRFIYDGLQQAGVRPNAPADPATLLRRVYFDLTGLPPSPEAVQAFTADPSPQHYARVVGVVDTLLASQAFGERWARHWMDVARYGESAGSSRDVLMIYAWRYRDYVIRAFNTDLPFDRFVTEQVAGDLLEAESEQERSRLQVATGLLAIGSKSLNGGNLTYDVIDDQIDVVSRSVLGLTVSCARCHDHKFDPIPTADYYSLAGIFLSTNTKYGGGIKRPDDAKTRGEVYVTLGPEPSAEKLQERSELNDQLAKLQKQVRASEKRVATLAKQVPAALVKDPDLDLPAQWNQKQTQSARQYQVAIRNLRQRREDLQTTRGQLESLPSPDYALGVHDANKITDANILTRGEKNQKGDRVQRGFLSALAPVVDPEGSLQAEIDDERSGRLELARWLTDANNPLTSRVAVNRIWQHLMGQGIVETVDNFGTTGLPPSHPELLDFLAHRFTHQHGWSQKSLIREIVLSNTYRMSSDFQREAYQIDPDNRLRWRMDRRRLEAEPLRDAILSVSGLLVQEPLAGSLVMEIGEGEVGRNLNTSVLEKPFDRRSVYLPIIRGIIPEGLKLFDFPEPSNVQGQRDSNTTPKQSLYLMNSPFVVRAAEHFAENLLQDPSLANDAKRIELAFLRCYARPPSDSETQRTLDFLRQMEQIEGTTDTDHRQWTVLCQNLMASAPFRFID